MEQLPHELIDLICERLTLKEISELCMLNKYFYHTMHQNTYYNFCKTCYDKNRCFEEQVMTNFVHFQRFYLSYFEKYNERWIFERACANGHLEIIQFLEEAYKNNIDHWKQSITFSFWFACGNGHINIVKHLTSVYSIFLEYDHFFSGFHRACEKGYSDIAKLIHQIYPQINVTGWMNYIFGRTCRYGHLKIAKWLIETFPEINIRFDDDDAFESACVHDCIDIARWLATLCPNYIFEEDPTGKISYEIV